MTTNKQTDLTSDPTVPFDGTEQSMIESGKGVGFGVGLAGGSACATAPAIVADAMPCANWRRLICLDIA